MKNHILDDIAPVQLNEALLIPVKINTVKLFGTDQIKFQILFNGRKIKIESPEILANQDFPRQPPTARSLSMSIKPLESQSTKISGTIPPKYI